MIITISGVAGAGKGTVGRILAERLSYNYYSMGDVRRKMALERGMTIEEFNRLGESESFTDVDADEYQKKLGKTEDNFVMDGRLSWYFMPHSVKIFLYCEPHEASRRIFHDHSSRRINQIRADTLEEQEKLTVARDESDHRRYAKYYGIKNLTDHHHFDLYIDDTHMTPEDVVGKIMEHIHLKKEKDSHILRF